MKRRNRLWALLLSAVMIITYMPLMTFAESEESIDEPVIFAEPEEATIEPITSGESERPAIQGPSETAEEDLDVAAPSEDSEQKPAVHEGSDKDGEESNDAVNDPSDASDHEKSGNGGKRQVKANEQNGAPAKSSGSMSFSYDSNGNVSAREWQYTPAETGYYALSASFNQESEYTGEREITIDIYQGDICLGELHNRDVDYSVHNDIGTLYLEKDKEYSLYLKEVFSLYSYPFTGSIDLIPVQASSIDEMFTVSNGVLKNYAGNLVTVTIPEGVKSAAYNVFSKMAEYDASQNVKKVSITFPSTMEEIDSENINAISHEGIPCSYFTVAEGNPNFKAVDGIVYSKDGTSLVTAPNYLEKDLLEIPEGVTSIGENAFTGGYNFSGGVNTIKLPDSLTKIGAFAFYNAHNLKHIEFGSAVTAIGEHAFGNSGLVEVEIPATVKTIGMNAFGDCRQLETVTFGAGNIHAGYWAFVGCESIKTLNINGNACFEDEAFSKCGSIANFNIGNSATEWEVVNDCLINNYDSKNHLHDYEFVSDDSYTSKELVLVSSDYSDEELIIADSIDEVHREAFYGANNIKSVIIGKKIKSISLPVDLESIALSSGNTHFQVKDNVLYEPEYDYIDGENRKTGKLVLIKYPMLSDVTDFEVADDVSYIAPETFAAYGEGRTFPLAKVVIPKDTGVEDKAFKIDNYSRESIIVISGYDGSPAHRYYQQNGYFDNLEWDSLGDSSRVSVTFDPNGGTVSTKTVSRSIGSAVGTLPKPVKKGSVFLGWYTSKTGGSKITSKTVVKKEVTYYAHWGFKVKFDANGGKASKTSMNVTEGAAIGKLPTAKKSGMFFLGWYTSKTGGKKVTAKTKITSGKTYYAHWTKAEIGDAKVTVQDCTWNGKARKPEVSVTLKGVKLSSKTDYTVTYSNNKEPGKGKVVVKGKGLFAKSKKTKTAYFKIRKAEQVITASDIVYSADKKGKIVNLKVTVKGKAPVTLTSSDSKIVSVTTKKADKAKGNIKLVKPGTATITIKTKATSHYLAGSKKVKVTLKGTQKIDLSASWLTYDKDEDVYICNGEVWNKSLGVKLAGQAKAVCTVYENGRNNLAWIESGDCLTARGKGDLVIKVTTEKTAAFPSATKYFTIRMNGSSMIDNTFSYRQLDSANISLITWFGKTPEVQIPVRITVDPGNNTTKLVTELGPSIFAGKQSLTKVTFPKATDDTVKSIGKEAFKGCTGLQEVRLPAGLTSLGEGAFSGCTALSKITMPDKIKILTKNVFENCSSLEGTFYLPNSTTAVEERALYGCAGIRRVMIYSYIRSVGENAFYGCTGIKNVYYSASEARWNSIQFASGNEAVTVNAKRHFNAATPSPYGSDYVPTDHELFNEHPEFLDNESYSTVVEILQSDMLQHLSTANVELAALKSVMMGGTTAALQALLEDAVSDDGITWSQEELEKALALDLIKDVASEDEVEAVKEKYMDRFNKVYEVVGEFKSEGDDIFKNNTTRYRFAQALSGCFEGDQRHDFNEMLKRIQHYWKPDSSDPNPPDWTIPDIYKDAGKAIEATDYVLEVIMLNELYRDYIDEVMPYIPEDTSLYRGFSQVKYMMDQPLEDYVATMLREDVTKELMKLSTDSLKKQFGSIGMAETIYKVIGKMILTPTIDDYNNAWLSLSNSIKLGQMLDDVNSIMIANKGGDNSALADDQKMIAMMYFQAVKTAGKYTLNTLKYDDDEEYFRQEIDRYEGALKYSKYIQSCKENLVESGELY